MTAAGGRWALATATRPGWSGQGIVLGAAAAAVGATVSVFSTSTAGAAVAFVLTILGCSTVLGCVSQRGVYGVPGFFLVLLGVFHGGVTISAALRGTAGDFSTSREWLLSPDFVVVNRLVVVGLVVFTLAAWLGRLATARPTRPHTGDAAPDTHAADLAGRTLLALGAVLVVWAIGRAGGAGLLTAGYIPFLQAVEGDQRLSYGQLLLGLGLVIGLCGGRRTRVAAWTVFSLYALASLYIGLRGAALFPLSAALVLLARRGRVPRPRVLLVSAVVLLFSISVIRQTRLGQWSVLSPEDVVSLPLDALAEMGSSLYPLFVVHRWREAGEAATGLDTVIAVPWNAFSRLVGSEGGLETFNQLVARRVGPIGGSPLAEGYLAGGVVGALAVVAVLGFVLGRADAAPAGTSADIWVGVLCVVVFGVVRNALGPAVAQFGIALVVVAVLSRLGSPSRARRAGSRGDSGREPQHATP